MTGDAETRRSPNAVFRAEPVYTRCDAPDLAGYLRQRVQGRADYRDRYPLRAEDEPERREGPCDGCREQECEDRGLGC